MLPDTETVRTDDGQVLSFCQWGDRSGRPVWYLHGAPGSRYLYPRGFDCRRWGVRLITYDRPGYGRSDRRPGRSVDSAATDVRAIADQLSLTEFAVVGVSAGGPHALAVAAGLGARVTRCAVISGLAPPDADGLDFYAGMAPGEAEEWQAMTAPAPDPAPIVSGLRDWLHGLASRPDDDPQARDLLVSAFTEALAQGPGGLVDDYVALSRPWGCEPATVSCPTTIMVAEDDANVPPTHGLWLADRLPGRRLIRVPGGHLDPRPAVTEEILRWAVDSS